MLQTAWLLGLPQSDQAIPTSGVSSILEALCRRRRSVLATSADRWDYQASRTEHHRPAGLAYLVAKVHAAGACSLTQRKLFQCGVAVAIIGLQLKAISWISAALNVTLV